MYTLSNSLQPIVIKSINEENLPQALGLVTLLWE